MRFLTRNWRSASLLLILLLALGLGVWFFWRKESSAFRWDLFAATFAQIRWPWMALSLVGMICTYLGRAIRWKAMMRPFQPDADVWRLTTATVIGFTAIVLFGRPGEIVRPYLIAQAEKTPLSSQLAIWLLERIYDLLLVLVVFGIGLAQVRQPEHLGPALTWVIKAGGTVSLILGILCVAVLVMLGRKPDLVQERLHGLVRILPDRFQQKLEGIVAGFTGGTASTRSTTHVVEVLGWSVLEWAVIVGSIYCFFRSLPATAHFGVTETVTYAGFIAFGGVVQIPGIGGGMQVAAVLVLTEILGIDFASATGTALLSWLTTYVIIVPLGLLLALRQGLKWSVLRRLEAE